VAVIVDHFSRRVMGLSVFWMKQCVAPFVPETLGLRGGFVRKLKSFVNQTTPDGI
jgi:hypothetical protein